MKIHNIQSAAERDSVMLALLHAGYTVSKGTEVVPNTKKKVSYIEYQIIPHEPEQ